jgi:hypothetical protein
MPADFSKIPQELRELKRWIAWRYLERDGARTKVPFCARTFETASSTNPAHWTDFDTVLKNGKYFRGPGLVIQPPYMAIDLDQCRDPQTGDAEPWAWEIIHNIDSYTEVSPSGRGFHIWIKGTMPVRGRKKKMTNTFIVPAEGKTPAVEVYRDGRYFTMSAQRLDVCGSGVCHCGDSIDKHPNGFVVGHSPVEMIASISPNVETRDISSWLLRTFGELTEAEINAATYMPADPEADNDPTASGEEFRIACAIVRDMGPGATVPQLCAAFLKRAKPRPKLKRKDYVIRTIINAQYAVKLHRGDYKEPYGDLF